jgi:hypothetical protein
MNRDIFQSCINCGKEEEMTLDGWSSISDSLMTNKCWICQQTFQKGKIKKVFQLSQLVSWYIYNCFTIYLSLIINLLIIVS